MVRSLLLVQGSRERVVGEELFSLTTGMDFQDGMKLSFVPGRS